MKLQSVLQALDAVSAGDSPSACNTIGAFLNEVSAQAGKTVTVSQPAQLTTLAQQVRAALDCR
jgi:hypothetical protein